MKKLFSGLLAICFTFSAMNVQAAYDPIEPAHEVSGKNIILPSTYTWGDTNGLMIAGGASFNSNATDNTLTITAGSVINETNVDIPNEVHNHYIVGGAVYTDANATGNTLNVAGTSGPGNRITITGRALAGGLSRVYSSATQDNDKWGTANVNNNTVNIAHANIDVSTQNSTSVFSIGSVPVAVAGGASQLFFGNVEGNTVNITDSTITGVVAGGFSFVEVSQEEIDNRNIEEFFSRSVSNNSVFIQNSTVTASGLSGHIFGSYGGDSGNNNVVRLDNTTVDGNVYGAANDFVWFNGGNNEATQTYDGNKVELLNNSKVASAFAVLGGNTNASNNSLLVQDSEISSGEVYSVVMLHQLGEDKVTGKTDYNSLTFSSATSVTTKGMGAALNMVGNPSFNSVTISDSNNLTVSSNPTHSLGIMSISDFNSQKLLATSVSSPQIDTARGYIFGGVTADYTAKLGVSSEEPEETILGFGSSADNNSITLQDSTVSANIIGGFAAYVRQEDYTVEEKNEQGSVTSKKVVIKEGRDTIVTTTTKTYGPDGTTETDSKTEGPTVEKTADLIDEVFSASNNTVTLKNVNFTGNIYAGYVDGAELKRENMLTKNNTVILEGNTSITGDVYGGSNAYYSNTNKLIFRQIADSSNPSNYVQFDPSKFHNFNGLYTVEGGYDTRLEFINKEVHASLVLDESAMKNDSQTIIKTFGATASGYGELECNGDPNCIKYTSDVSLANNRLGAYSYTLTPEWDGTTTIEWTLTGKKDKANMEVYGQLPLVGLALASEGGELLTHSVSDAWKSDNEVSTFLNGGYHHTRYETGSGFDLDSGLVQAGAWKKFNDELLGGFFAKYSNGSYETYPINVSGSANVFGGGLMTSYRYSETGRLEATVEAGYMDMDFESAALISSFDSKGVYYGASAGFVESLMQDLDLFANINWLHKGKDDIVDNLGQMVTFDAMQSLNLRFGADYTIPNINWDGVIPSIGLMGIYEFDGESAVEIDGDKNSDASLKGMSGRGQFSLAYQNNDSFLPLRTVFTVYGQLGNRRGFGGEVNISFEF